MATIAAMATQCLTEASILSHGVLFTMKQSCPSTSFPLMSLPTELRTRVYSYLCLSIHKDSCVSDKCNSKVFEWNCRCCAQLLCLSKQVRSEILPFVLNTNYLPFPSFRQTSYHPIDTVQFIHDLGPEKVRHIKRIGLTLEMWRGYSPSHIEELFKHLSIGGAQIEEIYLRASRLAMQSFMELLVLPCHPLPSLRLLAVVDIPPISTFLFDYDWDTEILSRPDLDSLNTELEKRAMNEKRDLTYSISHLRDFAREHKWEFGDRRLGGTTSVITTAEPPTAISLASDFISMGKIDPAEA
ncbi:hypothetical protein OCU04_004509 [Sclerotinia nivalis]|uniref:F-box domain-containing protein n=1 Tax=Sclerotinia nivalis TaxID=352851 RepID=A0A9X0AQK9_9HELO|nr:hypothetical protein OCU04_004509 [Sclerotinia nivalis]